MEGNRAIVRYLLNDFMAEVLPSIADELVPRDLSLGKVQEPKVGSTAKVIVGMRRSGKTFRMYQEILAIRKMGVETNRICYLNFDDDRLRPYPRTLVSDVLEEFYELNPEARTDGAYLFFDEVQDVPGWDVTVRRILDTEKVSLYVTGSSSRMLSEDVATEFRGRSISYELLPYSFREYLRAQGDEPAQDASLDSKTMASRLKRALRRYLVEGGFPAAQGLDDSERAQLLQGYAQLTVARDVVERFGFSNAAFARSLARSVITSSARDISISRLDNKSRAAGYSPGRATVTELVDAFEDAHLAYQVFEFSYSAQKVRLGGMKVYAADPGLYWASSIATDDGLTFAFETAAYLELRRRRRTGRLADIAMLKLSSGKEVDFVQGDATLGEVASLVQVCFDMGSSGTQEREVSALREAMERFGQKRSLILTFADEFDIAVEEGTIEVRPAWKWLLEDSA